VPERSVSAPSWEDMDKAIFSAKGWYRQLMLILRFTGLRRNQVLRLKWDDFDLQEKTLLIRGALGKTKHEQQGRLMYVSPHLVEHLRLWPKNSEWVVDKRIVSRSTPGDNNKRTRVNNRVPRQIWDRTDVLPIKYKQPLHCFRKGVNQGLFQLGVIGETRRYMLGHKADINELVYISLDVMAEKTKSVAASFPALTVDISPGQLL
jgi:integrase